MSIMFQICTFMLAGLAINWISMLLKSTFLCTFLDNQLIILLIALLAINTTTISVILTKMREIVERNPSVSFYSTMNAMRWASTEQLGLIIAAIVFEIVKSSPYLTQHVPSLLFILNGLLSGVLAFSIFILYDTARAVYIILDHGL